MHCFLFSFLRNRRERGGGREDKKGGNKIVEFSPFRFIVELVARGRLLFYRKKIVNHLIVNYFLYVYSDAEVSERNEDFPLSYIIYLFIYFW